MFKFSQCCQGYGIGFKFMVIFIVESLCVLLLSVLSLHFIKNKRCLKSSPFLCYFMDFPIGAIIITSKLSKLFRPDLSLPVLVVIMWNDEGFLGGKRRKKM